jgi:heme-degrading monooxygenase HmoA
MVARMWHGRTSAARTDEYTRYLQDVGLAPFKTIPGCRGAQMLRRTVGDVTEFLVISYWDSRDAIHAFAGADIGKPHHLPRDAEMLLELPKEVQHFDILVDERRP